MWFFYVSFIKRDTIQKNVRKVVWPEMPNAKIVVDVHDKRYDQSYTSSGITISEYQKLLAPTLYLETSDDNADLANTDFSCSERHTASCVTSSDFLTSGGISVQTGSEKPVESILSSGSSAEKFMKPKKRKDSRVAFNIPQVSLDRDYQDHKLVFALTDLESSGDSDIDYAKSMLKRRWSVDLQVATADNVKAYPPVIFSNSKIFIIFGIQFFQLLKKFLIDAHGGNFTNSEGYVDSEFRPCQIEVHSDEVPYSGMPHQPAQSIASDFEIFQKKLKNAVHAGEFSSDYSTFDAGNFVTVGSDGYF